MFKRRHFGTPPIRRRHFGAAISAPPFLPPPIRLFRAAISRRHFGPPPFRRRQKGRRLKRVANSPRRQSGWRQHSGNNAQCVYRSGHRVYYTLPSPHCATHCVAQCSAVQWSVCSVCSTCPCTGRVSTQNGGVSESILGGLISMSTLNGICIS